MNDNSENSELQKAIDKIGRKIRANSEKNKVEESEESKQQDEAEKVGKQMAFWPENAGAIPTELTRVSLFGLIRRGRRKILDWEKLASRADIEVSYFGKQLDQADADLWLACLRLGRGLPMGQRIFTNKSKLLKEIGRDAGTSNRTWLDNSLDRIASATLKIVLKRKDKEMTLRCKLMTSGVEEKTGNMFIRLDPEGAALFENLTYVDWEKRLALQSNAAKALQLYVCGHTTGKPHAVPLADLAQWLGYEGRLRQFRETLSEAINELKGQGLISDASIKRGARGEVASWVRIS